MIFETPEVAHDSAGIALGPWTFCAQPADAISDPDQLREANTEWQPAVVPGTVASALRVLGRWDISQPLDADACDWWYRAVFHAPADAAQHICALCFDGLATLTEVWLNGRQILTTDNMFRSYRADVSGELTAHNELFVVFRALTKFLSQQRPRPRWKTNLVNHQQLRWCRTTLLGRIPGWTPPVTAVGPWRTVRLEVAQAAVTDVHVTSELDGTVGRVTFTAKLRAMARIDRVLFNVGHHQFPVEIRVTEDGPLLHTIATIAAAPLWWPHTHGPRPLLECLLEIEAGGQRQQIHCGAVGFRHLEVDQNAGLAVKVNGVPVYCRGACWTVADIVTLDASPDRLAHDLHLARDAGINMLRVGGTMIYESDRFYSLCDQLGILIWQDFQFANMDYPVEDPAFAKNIETEASQQLCRLASHPCVAVYCGNSEVEQQAAMLGMPRDLWRNRWFAERLPVLFAMYHPGTDYIPSTPSGGTLPFHVKTGVSHYYGVGAYLRPISDVRRADVKFTPECLGSSNVPEPETVNLVARGGPAMLHHPRWKERVPRDIGPGWDFEDVRDHYLKLLFGVDPVALRSLDTERYLRLSRVVTGEVMAQVFAEWRSGHSHNRGGLVWFFKDLWPGAGWGIIDSLGVPKAVYYYLKRSWQTLQVAITDEGLDGLHLHVINETAETFPGSVELMLLKDDHVVVARKATPCELAARTQQMLESDAILDGFYDVAYAYRFGPPQHDVAVATLLDGAGNVVSEAFHFVQPREPALLSAVALEVEAEVREAGCYEVRLKADRFLRSACFDAKGFLPSDNCFHLVPGREKKVMMRPIGAPGAKLKASVEALNLREPVRIPLRKS